MASGDVALRPVSRIEKQVGMANGLPSRSQALDPGVKLIAWHHGKNTCMCPAACNSWECGLTEAQLDCPPALGWAIALWPSAQATRPGQRTATGRSKGRILVCGLICSSDGSVASVGRLALSILDSQGTAWPGGQLFIESYAPPAGCSQARLFSSNLLL